MAEITFSADMLAVRDALSTLFETHLLRSLCEDARGTAELVLAEALNNIVEHAYASTPGEIRVTLQLRQSELRCQIIDSGRPMPGGVLPMGTFRPVGAMSDLPEGGFGWGLIRSLSRDLRYRRVAGRNHLSFGLNAEQSLQ